MSDHAPLAAVLLLAENALSFGRVDRTVVCHPDGTPESDTDHTVAIGWLAASLADLTEPGLDVTLVAAFALTHDAVEVYAGDTPTIKITSGERAAKRERERAAAEQWLDDLGTTGGLTWMYRIIRQYESQRSPEARFVHAVDKLAPKLVHLLNGCTDLLRHGITPADFTSMVTVQRAALARSAGEFTGLLSLYDEVTAQVLATLETAWAGKSQ